MSKLSRKIKHYKCEINSVGEPHFYYDYKPIRIREMSKSMFKQLKCQQRAVKPLIISGSSYLTILPGELRYLLLHYLSRFELLEAFRYPKQGLWGLFPSTIDENFWKEKLLTDFASDFNKYKVDIKEIQEKGKTSGWKNLYTIFTYAEAYGENINDETGHYFMRDVYDLFIPELIDAYMNSEWKSDFIKYMDPGEVTSYVLTHYPKYLKFYIFNLLITNPSYLVIFLKENPKIKVSLMDLAMIADKIGLETLIEREAQQYYDDLGDAIDEA